MSDPQHDYERALIACAILDHEAAHGATATVSHTDFDDGVHRNIWLAICTLCARREPVDLITLADELGRVGHGETAATIAKLTDAVPSAANWSYYAGKVRQGAVTKYYKLTSGDEQDVDAGVALQNRIEHARAMLDRWHGRRPGGAQRRAVPATEVGGERPQRILQAAGMSGGVLSVGTVTVLAGEGGAAKSPLALSVALGLAARDGWQDLHGGLFAGHGGPVLAVINVCPCPAQRLPR